MISIRALFGSKEITNPKNIFLEYISANPTGPLHIGHVRGAVYINELLKLFSVVALSIKVALNLMGIKAKDIMEN